MNTFQAYRELTQQKTDIINAQRKVMHQARKELLSIVEAEGQNGITGLRLSRMTGLSPTQIYALLYTHQFGNCEETQRFVGINEDGTINMGNILTKTVTTAVYYPTRRR